MDSPIVAIKMPEYKYKTKSGKQLWYCSFCYVDWMGVRKRKVKRGFLTKREAHEYEVMFKDRRAKDPTILFSSLMVNYYEDCETRLKPTTMETKKDIIESKILPFFGNTRICDIDVAMVRRWQNELINYRSKGGNPYSQTYLKTINNQLSAIMNYACRFYGLPQNPIHITGSIGKSHADEKPFWTHDEYRHFRMFEKKPSYLLAFDILFYGGIREGELLAIVPEDFDRKNMTLRIDENFAVVKDTEYILTPKTSKSMRTITLPKSVFDAAISYIDKLQIRDGERIFYFKKSGLITEFHRCSDRAGLPRIRIHDLRGSHASLLSELGTPVKSVSDRLGHESTSTTMRTYTHQYPQREKELADRLDGIIADADAKKEAPEGADDTDI